MKKLVWTTGWALACLIPLSAQQDIASARAMGSGAAVTVSGIVTNGDELGTIRYMQDQTAGIAIYSSELKDVQRGDSITVSGTLKDYISLLEIDPVSSVTVHSSGNALPDPQELTPEQFNEQYEGMLVRVDQATINTSGTFQREAYGFTAGGETGQLYINDPYSPLIGTPIPSGHLSITGPLGAYDGTYQLLPRDLEDVISYSSIQIIEAPSVSGLSQTGFTLEWLTDVAGSTEAKIGLTPELELAPVKLSGTTTSHAITIDERAPAELFYMQAFSVHEEDTAKAALKVIITVSESNGSIRALFNRPVDRSLSLGLLEPEYLPEELDDELILYIDQAEESIDLALYNLNNTGISDITRALNQAHTRGVVVRAVYDGDINAQGMQSLDSDIGKIASPRSDYPNYGIMHNKFVVIDAESADPLLPVVWTGSTNFSYNQINTDPNNVIVLQDQSLARAYRLEFNEMFGSDGPQPDPENARFGPDKTDNTPHEFIIGGKRVECYFSPSDGTHQQILNTISTSDHSINVATMLITKQDIGDALALKSDQGKEVQVLLDDYDQYGEPIANTLKATLGADFRLNGEAGIMHHKYMIVDQAHADADPLVLTGSHNWSASAQLRNDENTLIVHDQGAANVYYQEFVPRFRNGEVLVSDGPNEEWLLYDSRIEIYPNPASGWIHIKTGEGIEIDVLSLRDPSGREMVQYINKIPSGIDISQLRGGLYLLHIKLSGGEHIIRKIIITK
ncbi:MAG: phospholipase D-like domain-containing protein [Bacteroidota bacterium]|nr:phospholipase D-like domain-containing protein [Bacteroidota bacterium]